jgi:hypothetical protein
MLAASKHRALLVALVLGVFAAEHISAADCPDSKAQGVPQNAGTPAGTHPDKTQPRRCPKCAPAPPAQPVQIDVQCPAATPILFPIGRWIDASATAPSERKPRQEPSKAPTQNKDSQSATDASISIEQAIRVVALLAELGLIGVLAVLGLRLLGRAGLQEELLFRRYWGGFGGEASGWTISAPLGKCLAGLLLIALAAAMTAQTLWILHDDAKQQTTAAAPPDRESGTGQTSPQEDDLSQPSASPAKSPALTTAAR